MKRALKWVAGIAAFLLVVAGGGLAYLYMSFPRVGPAPEIRVESTAERIRRGEYLANHVTVCIDCHSDRDWRYFSGPIVPGTEGQGGFLFDENFGFPGKFYSKNITPAALGDWTDGEILRAITSGVSRTGKPFFPVMPYPAYRYLVEEDLHSIVAYLSTLAPIENEVPDSRPAFPMNLILRTLPQPASPLPAPDPSDPVATGKYLVTIAGCADCHTPSDERGQKIADLWLAGGFPFAMPEGTVWSSNITPDPETGIGEWDREFFIKRFKFYGTAEAQRQPLAPGEVNTVMPWTMYAGMTEDDLGAIYAYLRSVPPIRNAVEKSRPLP